MHRLNLADCVIALGLALTIHRTDEAVRKCAHRLLNCCDIEATRPVHLVTISKSPAAVVRTMFKYLEA